MLTVLEVGLFAAVVLLLFWLLMAIFDRSLLKAAILRQLAQSPEGATAADLVAGLKSPPRPELLQMALWQLEYEGRIQLRVVGVTPRGETLHRYVVTRAGRRAQRAHDAQPSLRAQASARRPPGSFSWREPRPHR